MNLVPVLVTSAHRAFARDIVLRLLEEGGQVRATALDGVDALRAAGAHVAVAAPDDEGRLEAALTSVHTLVHPVGGLTDGHLSTLVDEARGVARAASAAGVRRVIVVTIVGAAPDATDRLRRAHAAVEDLFAQSEAPSVVVRASLVDDPVTRDVLLTAGLDADLMERPMAPVRRADLVELIVRLDRARSEARTGHLVVAAVGPVRMPLAALLPGGRPSLVGRRLLDAEAREVLVETLAGPWTDPDPTLPDGFALMGIAPSAPEPPAPSATDTDTDADTDGRR
jgi:uncharacterized protein YbjT (DUF2867 family)